MADEITAIWRNGITNTVAVIDIARARFSGLVRLTPSQRAAVEAYDAFIDKALDDWFKATRAASPATYTEAEAVFKSLQATDREG